MSVGDSLESRRWLLSALNLYTPTAPSIRQEASAVMVITVVSVFFSACFDMVTDRSLRRR